MDVGTEINTIPTDTRQEKGIGVSDTTQEPGISAQLMTQFRSRGSAQRLQTSRRSRGSFFFVEECFTIPKDLKASVRCTMVESGSSPQYPYNAGRTLGWGWLADAQVGRRPVSLNTNNPPPPDTRLDSGRCGTNTDWCAFRKQLVQVETGAAGGGGSQRGNRRPRGSGPTRFWRLKRAACSLPTPSTGALSHL